MHIRWQVILLHPFTKPRMQGPDAGEPQITERFHDAREPLSGSSVFDGRWIVTIANGETGTKSRRDVRRASGVNVGKRQASRRRHR